MSESQTFAEFLRVMAPAVILGAGAGGAVVGRAVHLWHTRRNPQLAHTAVLSARKAGRQNACEACRGSGFLQTPSTSHFARCPRCHGSGESPDLCPECRGSGFRRIKL